MSKFYFIDEVLTKDPSLDYVKSSNNIVPIHVISNKRQVFGYTQSTVIEKWKAQDDEIYSFYRDFEDYPIKMVAGQKYRNLDSMREDFFKDHNITSAKLCGLYIDKDEVDKCIFPNNLRFSYN